MKQLWWLFAGGVLLQKLWKQWSVWRFFRKPLPPATSEPKLVSILQPILSGDPTLGECLQANLDHQTSYRLEFIWLIDSNDPEAQRLCANLAKRQSQHTVRIVTLPPPEQRMNPKMSKLIAGLPYAKGDIICVLDDDTRLPDFGLEQCLPFLDQPNVGLAFGLPYYKNFSNIWSSLVSLFVNNQSLMTYIPYTNLAEPFTINGMFYAIRRSVLDSVGGFAGLQYILADDFAIAERFRQHGYRLVQTPLRHAISTTVTGPRHYVSLMQRWFIFPRESLMRHLNLKDRAVLYGMGLLPALFPLVLLLALIAKPTRSLKAYAGLYTAHSLYTFWQINRSYLRSVTPRKYAWLAPLVEMLFPLQLLVALLSPQRINWRGHIMQVEEGGGFYFVRRRDEHDDA